MAGLASNPSTAQQLGLQNIPMNTGGAGVGGVTPDAMLQTLTALANQDLKPTNIAAISTLEKLYSGVQNQEYKNSILAIINNIKSNIANGVPTYSLDRGKKIVTPKELIEELKHTVQEQNKLAPKNPTEQNRMSKEDVILIVKEAQNKEVTKPKKKDSRGNPFRVLMGKVGKLLDHGLEKREIVRYLSKLKYWNEETISKAVDIVKDYNKKKKNKPNEEKNDNKKSFNYFKYLKTAGKDVIEYDIEPDYKKRSTAELYARITWLESLNRMNPKEPHAEGREAANKEGIKGEIRKLKTELLKRGAYND